MLLCIVKFGLYRRRRNTLRPSSKEKVFPIFGAAMVYDMWPIFSWIRL